MVLEARMPPHIDRGQLHSFKWQPFPFRDCWKSYYFLLQLTVRPGPFHWWKQAKPTLCVCLLEKIASFIYRPLALFSQWIPGLNAISQETLPMCSPVIPHCSQAESNTARGKGAGRGPRRNTASQAIKIQTPVSYTQRPYMCFNWFQTGREREGGRGLGGVTRKNVN